MLVEMTFSRKGFDGRVVKILQFVSIEDAVYTAERITIEDPTLVLNELIIAAERGYSSWSDIDLTNLVAA